MVFLFLERNNYHIKKSHDSYSAAVPIAVVKYNPIIANKIDMVTKIKLAMTNEINDLHDALTSFNC